MNVLMSMISGGVAGAAAGAFATAVLARRAGSRAAGSSIDTLRLVSELRHQVHDLGLLYTRPSIPTGDPQPRAAVHRRTPPYPGAAVPRDPAAPHEVRTHHQSSPRLARRGE